MLDIDYYPYILEGTARAEAILGRIEDARRTISQAWDTHWANKYPPFQHKLRGIETVRTEVETTARSKKKRYSLPEKDIKQAILKSQELGYIRMTQQIKMFKNIVEISK